MAKWFKKKSKKTVEAKETAVAGLSTDTVESARAEESVHAESVVEEDASVTAADKYAVTATKESTLPPGKEAPSAEETTVLMQVASIQNEIEPTSSADRSVQKVTTCDASIVDIDDDDEKEDCKTQVTLNDENTYVDRSVQKVTTCDASIVDIDDDDEKEDCKTQVTLNDENTYVDRSVQKVTTCDASIVDIDDDDEKEDNKTQVTFNDENTYVDDESTIEESENIDPLEYKRVDTMHAQLKIPLSAKSGDYLVINHGGARSIKVPTGQQGQSITVKMVQNEKEEEVPSTGFLCCM